MLTWKPVGPSPDDMNSNVQKTKAEARLGILGYLDPKLQVSNPGSKLKDATGPVDRIHGMATKIV